MTPTPTPKPKTKRRRRNTEHRGHVWKPNKGCKYWYLRYRDSNGQMVTDTSGKCTSRGDAEALLQQKFVKMDNNEPVTAALSKFTYDDAVKDLLNDYDANGYRSRSMVQRYITKHLTPFFGGKRMTTITPDIINAYVAKRRAHAIVVKGAHDITRPDGSKVHVPAQTKLTSNSEINRELTTLKRAFSLAIENGKLVTKPHIKMLKEAPPRKGFLSATEFAAVKKHLPEAAQGIAEFGFLTGWRIASEVVPLEWKQVDFDGGTVRLEPGQSKTDEPREFPMTAALRALLLAQQTTTKAVQKRLNKVIPLVFHDEGVRISRFDKLWKVAATAAGHPGTIPHDLRRCGVRNLVRAGVPERVAMQMTGHKTRSVFERYNIVSKGDFADAVRRVDGVALESQKRA